MRREPGELAWSARRTIMYVDRKAPNEVLIWLPPHEAMLIIVDEDFWWLVATRLGTGWIIP